MLIGEISVDREDIDNVAVQLSPNCFFLRLASVRALLIRIRLSFIFCLCYKEQYMFHKHAMLF